MRVVTLYLLQVSQNHGQHLELKKIQHKYYTLKRAFPPADDSEGLTEEAAASAHAAIVKQVCQ